MALRDQPYLPLYIQDFITDEKLIECSASATGVYIRLMCIMHKSDDYGMILLKQKDKQDQSTLQNFAIKIARFMPYTVTEIKDGLAELLENGVIQIIGSNKMVQKRMVRDNEISEIRSKAGKKGGLKTQEFAKAKIKANTEIENEYDINKKKEEYEEKKDLKVSVKKPTYVRLFDKVLEKEQIQLPEGFYDLILEWLKYKSEKGQGYKETGLKNLIIKFLNDSGGDYDTAKSMIFYSVSNNYTGLFKEKNHERTKAIKPATDFDIAEALLKNFKD
ncbi:MAG: hypothetical protein ACOXZV_00545 [Bacteroidales bacterium]